MDFCCDDLCDDLVSIYRRPCHPCSISNALITESSKPDDIATRAHGTRYLRRNPEIEKCRRRHAWRGGLYISSGSILADLLVCLLERRRSLPELYNGEVNGGSGLGCSFTERTFVQVKDGCRRVFLQWHDSGRQRLQRPSACE